ncbi:ZIP-like iron-zinc transporter [Trametopsis cervina]|nr:ZIP-like iron-zinc transporter [Trametopsis cervina]
MFARDVTSDEQAASCGDAAVFVILAGSSLGALFPVLSRRTRFLRSRIPKGVFDTAKYFGSGVIIATAFIHLLDPAIQALNSPCLSPAWSEYPYALGLTLISIFFIFIVELIAMRWGTTKLAALGIVHDPHSPGETGTETEGRISTGSRSEMTIVEKGKETHVHHDHQHHHHHHHPPSHTHDLESGHHPEGASSAGQAISQLVGIAILEFGVLLHSFLIGLTLAVTQSFKVLFVVIVFHQTFEGLGVGSRLAYVDLSGAGPRWNRAPIWAAVIFGVTTPLGIAIGLGVRETYNPGSAIASIVSGVLDAFSAGVLIYTGLVELLAHDFLFNPTMIRDASNKELAYAVGCVMLGCGLMALLGRWA